MKRINLHKSLKAAVCIGGTILSACALADTPQGGSGMMDGYGTGWMREYGGILVIVVAGLVGWILAEKEK
jgi:hypothetical protein